MKLYTEEQMLQAILDSFLSEYPTNANDILSKLTPIELPSDDEISEKLAFHAHGARWVINRIKQQIKQQYNGHTK